MGFNRPVNQNTDADRVVAIAAGQYAYYNFVGDINDASLKYARELSAMVFSDADVTHWFEWGRAVDSAASLPYASTPSTVLAGDSKGQIVSVCGAPQRVRHVVYNAGGSTANIIRDLAVYG